MKHRDILKNCFFKFKDLKIMNKCIMEVELWNDIVENIERIKQEFIEDFDEKKIDRIILEFIPFSRDTYVELCCDGGKYHIDEKCIVFKREKWDAF